MLVVIALAVGSTLYIPGYQHVYSQSQPLALHYGASDSPIIEVMEDEGYVVESTVVFSDPSSYDVVILEGSLDSQGMSDIIDYVENGGGLVYLSGAAESLDLEANHGLLGAQALGFSGFGDNATISSSGPFGSNLLAGDPVRLQSAEQSGALWVNNLESGADSLASYASGNVFAYSYEPAGARVYFQAYSDAGVAGAGHSAHANVEALLKLGIIWATSEPGPVTDLLPPGTLVEPESNEPFGSVTVAYSEAGPQSQVLSVPDSTKSIFVTADAGLVNPVLFFEIDGQEYRYNIPIGDGTLLTFPSFVNITNARFEVDDWSGGFGTVGYVNLRNPPSCNLPDGAVRTNPSSIPPDARTAGSTGLLGSVHIASPPVPVSSILVGFDQEVNGYLLSFESGGVQFECPIQPGVIEIAFDEPILLSDASVENDGPWGLVGYIENLGDATAYAKFALPKETVLPDGIVIEPASAAPSKVYSASFSQDHLEVFELTGPSTGVSALWFSAEPNLANPFVYFSVGDKWYSADIGQSNSTVKFPGGIVIDEVYVSADGGQQGTVTVGYLYPIKINARAGSDQSVQEEQIVYLDGRSTTGPIESLSFKWTQIEGTSVTLRDASSPQAHFDAPAVDELGARLSFRLVVTDSGGSQSSDIVVINVKNERAPRNLAPEIGSIAGATVDEGTHVVLAASAFDSDGDTLRYLWTQKNGPAADLSGKNMATLSFNAPEVASDSLLTFELRVSDGRGHAVTRDVLVTVINVHNEIVTNPGALISAGQDQVVLEGSVVELVGSYHGDSADKEFRWEQMAGPLVSLEKSSLLTASFAAPQISEDATRLSFRLGMFDSEGALVGWDDVSITVNNTALVEIEQDGPSSLEVGGPSFTAVKRVDTEPPSEIHILSIPGSAGANSPTPIAPVVGIWVNATLDMAGLELHFGSSGRKYSISADANQATAYVFDRQVEIKDVRLTAASDVQSVGIGYYYGQVPLMSVPSSSLPTSTQEEPAPIQAMPPAEGAIIKFARENQLIAGLVAIAVPVGIGVGLKLASTNRRKRMVNPAKALFGKTDPVAGEAEKVRPVIEELERMLGRNLDTALSASELLDKFGSGRNEVSQR